MSKFPQICLPVYFPANANLFAGSKPSHVCSGHFLPRVISYLGIWCNWCFSFGLSAIIQSPPQMWIRNTLQPNCIRFRLLHNNYPKVSDFNNAYLLSHNFCGLEVWTQLNWAFYSGSHQTEIKVSAGAVLLSWTQDPLPTWLTLAQFSSLPLEDWVRPLLEDTCSQSPARWPLHSMAVCFFKDSRRVYFSPGC